MKILEKNQAIVLRKQGKSLNEIRETLKVSKASVSLWVRDIVLTREQRKKLTQKGLNLLVVEKRRVSRITNGIKKTRIAINQAKKEIQHISKNDLKNIGIALYMGEGGKTKRGVVRLANSDPAIIRIIMKFFREICLVPLHKFRGHIHTFSKANSKKSEIYWSRISGIPLNQFYKTYTKNSIAGKNKRNTLPYGTVEVSINDTQLFLRITGWIDKMKELIL